MKNWKTTFFGSLAAVTQLAISSGVHVGHVAGTDFLSLLSPVALTLFAYYAVDHKPAAQ